MCWIFNDCFGIDGWILLHLFGHLEEISINNFWRSHFNFLCYQHHQTPKHLFNTDPMQHTNMQSFSFTPPTTHQIKSIHCSVFSHTVVYSVVSDLLSDLFLLLFVVVVVCGCHSLTLVLWDDWRPWCSCMSLLLLHFWFLTWAHMYTHICTPAWCL